MMSTGKIELLRRNLNRGGITLYIQIFIFLLLLLTPATRAQQLSREKIVEALEKDGCVTLEESKVKICKYDLAFERDTIEAISFQPAASGRHPGVLLIPGYQGDAKGYITLGKILAQQGFACLSVAHPGFGKSRAKPDFVGPETVRTLIEAFRKFQREPYVDAEKMGIFGYSRGAMAASLIAVQLKDVKAAVFGAGVYDFKKAFDEVTIEGIRENMRAETGMTAQAIKERSSVLQMKNLKCPVLILHSEKDENVPVSQAYVLRDRLTQLKKDFEVKISPTGKHGFMDGDFVSNTINFFKRRLTGAPAKEIKIR
jgi:dipeptidyl aminopeptidase/acylaminoacyl peptidase